MAEPTYMLLKGYQKYRREYTFTKMIGRYNEMHRSHPDKQITTNTAIMLRFEWEVEMAKLDKEQEKYNPVDVFNKIVASDKWNLVDYDATEHWDVEGDSREFDGIANNGNPIKTTTMPNGSVKVVLDGDGYIPISSHGAFSNHMNVLEKGNQFCAVKNSDVMAISGSFKDIASALYFMSSDSANVARQRAQAYIDKSSKGGNINDLVKIYEKQFTDVGLYLVNEDGEGGLTADRASRTIKDKEGREKTIEFNFAYKYDGLGFSKLARYIDNDELNVLKDCVKNANWSLVPKGSVYVPENVATTIYYQVQCLTAMCQYLDDNGYVYHIKNDVGDYADETMLLIEGTDLKCRAIDLHSLDNLRHGVANIGNRGLKYYFSSATHTGESETDIRPTPEMSVALLKYALGDTVNKKTVDGKGNVSIEMSGQYTEDMTSTGDCGVVRLKGKTGEKGISRCSLGRLDLWDKGFNTSIVDTAVKSANTELTIRTVNKHVSPVHDFTKSTGLTKQEPVFDANGNFSRDEDGDPEYRTVHLDTEEWLRSAIESAKRNFENEINVDYILDNFERHIDKDDTFEYEFSTNAKIAAIQQDYVSVLEGKLNKLTMPKVGRIDTDEEEDVQNNTVIHVGEEVGDITFEDKADVIRRHSVGFANNSIGDLDVNKKTGYRFNPVIVMQFMDDEVRGSSINTNRENLKGAMRQLHTLPMRQLHILPDELFGDKTALETGFTKDLVYYDADKSEFLSDKAQDNEFWADIYTTVKDALESNGVKIDEQDGKLSLFVDNKGVIHYEGYITYGKAFTGKGNNVDRRFTHQAPFKLQGEVGQVFVPDEKGVVRTHFSEKEGSDLDYAFVSGYNGHIRAQLPGENKSLEERTILLGYKQYIARAIKQNISFNIRSLPFIESVTVANLSQAEQNRLKRIKHKNKSVSTYDLSQEERDRLFSRHISDASSLNKVYRHLYDERYDYDFENKFLEQGVPQDVLDDIIKTQAGRVKYHTMFKEQSTMHAAFDAARESNVKLACDRTKTPYSITGRRDMSILTEQGRGYFDNIATNMTTKNQGTVRYLAQGAKVGLDGHIIPYTGTDESQYKCALMNNDVMKYAQFDPADRQCMAFSNIMQCHSIVKGAHVAHMSVGGWNFDDGMVVSKAFADAHKIPAGHGGSGKRSLMVGDKLSDMHGNKGVIAAVVDPNLNDEETKKLYGSLKMRDLFKNNPDLEIVQAPTYLPSRMNGGIGRELCASVDKKDLVISGRDAVKSGISQMDIIITDKDADAKTNVYDDEAIKEGKGRKSSAQIAWSFDAKECIQFMNEVYGMNDKTIANYKEYLLLMGMNMDSITSQIMNQTVENFDELDADFKNRQVLDPCYEMLCNDKNYSLKMARFDVMVKQVLENKGGFIDLPFEIEYPNEKKLLPVDIIDKNNIIKIDNKVERYGSREGYLLPLIAYDLRTGTEFQDGSVVEHDYTKAYTRILENAVKYTNYKESNVKLQEIKDIGVAGVGDVNSIKKRVELFRGLPLKIQNDLVDKVLEDYNKGKASKETAVRTGTNGVLPFVRKYDYDVNVVYTRTVDKQLVEHSSLTPKTLMNMIVSNKTLDYVMAKNEKECDFYAKNSQRWYNRDIIRDIKDHKLCNKHNIYRDKIMSVRLPKSATSIWTADPTLDIDQLAVSEEIAEKINIREGDEVLIWRDPALRTSNQRTMKAKIVDNIKGVAINPAMDKCFDGDFDGDTVAVVSMADYSDFAKRELKNGFGVKNTLLDKGHLHDGVRGDYDLNIQDTLDIQMYLHENEDAKEELESLRVRANSATRVAENEETIDEGKKSLDKVVEDLSRFYRTAFDNSFGHALSFESLEDYAKSVYDVCIKTGAKGNDKKFVSACQWLGIDTDVKDGEVVINKIADAPFNGDKSVLDEKNHEVQGATMTKAVGTGMAGMFSIRAYSSLRELCGEAVLELTYPVTQGTVQVKHDADKATTIFGMMKKPLRDHWCGYKVELNDDGDFVTCMELNEETNKVEPVVATKQEWMDQFKVLYGEKGLDVDFNPEFLDVVCESIQKVCDIVDSDQMGNIEEDCVHKNVLDSLAYDGRPGKEMFENLCEIANSKKCLFDFKNEDALINAFAPNQLKANYKLTHGEDKVVMTTGSRYKEENKERKNTVKEYNVSSLTRKNVLDKDKVRFAKVEQEHKKQRAGKQMSEEEKNAIWQKANGMIADMKDTEKTDGADGPNK